MKIFLSILVLGVTVSSMAHAAFDPLGYWLIRNERAVIKIEPCDDIEKGELCGHIAWIIDGGMQYDAKNPVERLRGQPMCGLEILQGFKQSSADADFYYGGMIYKADDGDVYNANMKIRNGNELILRGFRGISLLGDSHIWSRVDKKDYPSCQKPESFDGSQDSPKVEVLQEDDS